LVACKYRTALCLGPQIHLDSDPGSLSSAQGLAALEEHLRDLLGSLQVWDSTSLLYDILGTLVACMHIDATGAATLHVHVHVHVCALA